jgi:hypothetical protein
VKGEASEQISIDAIAKRIPAVRPTYKRVLACLSEGLSNTEIALSLTRGTKLKQWILSFGSQEAGGALDLMLIGT